MNIEEISLFLDVFQEENEFEKLGKILGFLLKSNVRLLFQALSGKSGAVHQR